MKKTLVISAYAPPSGSGSGLMMYNLLKFFPKEYLSILTSEENTDPAFIKYKLDVPYYYYGSRLLAMKFNDKKEGLLQKFKRALKNNFVGKFFAQFILLFAVPSKIVKVGERAVKEQGSEVLLGYSDWGLNLWAVYRLHKKTKLPFVLHFYDMYVGNKMPWAFRLLAAWLEPKLFREAKEISVMCEELKDHYEKKYRREIKVIHNSIIFDSEKPPVGPDQKEKTKKFRIIFLGNVYWAQEGALLNLIKAVNEINTIDVELLLYTPHSDSYLNSIGIYPNEKIKFTFCLPEEALKKLNSSELVFVGLSFGTNYPHLINTSSPGKLCDYLVCGTPILVHAPKESFMAKYAKEHNFAYVVDADSAADLKQTILFATSDENKNSLTQNAWQLAVKNHQAKLESEKLINLLI